MINQINHRTSVQVCEQVGLRADKGNPGQLRLAEEERQWTDLAE